MLSEEMRVAPVSGVVGVVVHDGSFQLVPHEREGELFVVVTFIFTLKFFELLYEVRERHMGLPAESEVSRLRPDHLGAIRLQVVVIILFNPGCKWLFVGQVVQVTRPLAIWGQVSLDDVDGTQADN